MPLAGCRVDGRLEMVPIQMPEEGGGGGVQRIELDFTVTSPGTEAQFRKVQELLRSRCVLYRFAKAATEVVDRWKLVPPAG